MKIAIGIFRLVPRGGLEDHAIRIAEELARRGHAVTLFTTGQVPELGVATVSLQSRRKALTNHGRLAAFAADFAKATSGQFDRIVGFQPMPDLDVLFLADHLRNREDTSLLKRVLPRSRAFVRLETECFGAQSRTRIMGLARPQMAAFAQRYPKSRQRMVILPPTITEAKRNPHLRTIELREEIRARHGIQHGSPTWLWLGLQPHIKGLDRVLQALALVPNAVLLAGGIERGDRKLKPLISKAQQLGISHRIRWLGFLSRQDLSAHMATADVLAHPARVDVTGSVILEAVINGLPVVATSHCGFAPHVERAGAGRLVSPDDFDTQAFAAALVEVCGPGNAQFSLSGITYGQSPQLYSGLSVACDLIEADVWPVEITLAADHNASGRSAERRA
jgi:UDP-glucose:(heptosyl)LPS alpha-1,3-glucosyltransferase